ncbi:MAG TPA: ComF family protein [Nitrospirae bacterium]|nr:DNA utilization protein GntX [bacterium BMS3Abin10]GBE38368.1 DNA utilization protein GntX [bacterium BMS3Bbin08]HDH50407.1 ComF family protein [Nitrospirota bacterium]HDK82642.1 ComF family protein [Nitrospirota bacterium]HDO25417.1 ComF family protein [Nitrospirota bacterium]
MFNRFLRIFFPEHCPVCEKPSLDHRTAPICRECWQSILPYTGPVCQRCGRPLVSDVSIICKGCIEDEPSFERASSFGLYEGALRQAINLLKYRGVKRLSAALADMMLDMQTPVLDAVIPVPLYKTRLRQREFNQSAIFAKHLAGSTGTTLILDCLIKVRDTAPQVGLSAKQRRKNIKNAFEITRGETVRGKDILLVDDVFTTGATVRECSKLLKKTGAENIYVITLAHGSRDY